MASDSLYLLDRCAQGAQRKKAADPDHFRRLARSQHPRFFWIGCSDSRVSATRILDLRAGQIFVHRNIANLASGDDPNFSASLQYAVAELAVEHIFVVGHLGCGGIHAAMQPLTDDPVGRWLAPVRALYRTLSAKEATLDADGLCIANICAQVASLSTNPVIEAAWRNRQKLAIHGWVYVIEEGLLKPVCDPVQGLA